MKKLKILSVIFILTISLCAQTEENQTDNISLEATSNSDSLSNKIVIYDSLDEQTKYRNILTEMNTFIKYKSKVEKNLLLPYLIYKENFHLASPFGVNLNIRRNGFTEIPFSISDIQKIQNNRNIYNTIYKRDNILFDRYKYDLPVAITEVYMGLGDIDMNHISVSVMKGGLFGIPTFDMQFDFIGEKGKWLGYEDEASQNFNLQLSYNILNSIIYFENTIIDQELPGEKDIYQYSYPQYVISNRENSYSISVENKLLDFGLKFVSNDYQMGDIFSQDRRLMQFLAKKNFQSINHNLELSFEALSEDIGIINYSNPDTIKREKTYNIFSYDQDSDMLGLQFGNTGYYKNENIYQHNSELIIKLFKEFSIIGEFATKSDEYFTDIFSNNPFIRSRSKVGGGVKVLLPFFNIKAIMGQHHIEDFNGNYFYLQNSIKTNLSKRIEFTIYTWFKNEKTTYRPENISNIINYPELQISNDLELKYNLAHNNALKLGLNHVYHSSYSYTLNDHEIIFNNSTQNLDARLAIQLTEKFEISVDAINLTNNKVWFINQDHPDTHFNFNVHWIFIN